MSDDERAHGALRTRLRKLYRQLLPRVRCTGGRLAVKPDSVAPPSRVFLRDSFFFSLSLPLSLSLLLHARTHGRTHARTTHACTQARMHARIHDQRTNTTSQARARTRSLLCREKRDYANRRDAERLALRRITVPS